MWVVAQLAEHRTVTAAVEGSTPFDPPNLARNCGREVRHLIVNQADDGSSPFSSANLNGVWCNASIRVLGTRGDSSTLSSPTKRFAPVAQMEERDASNVEAAGPSPARSPKSSHPRTSAGRRPAYPRK